jgi:hypothetical protein
MSDHYGHGGGESVLKQGEARCRLPQRNDDGDVSLG